jgi:hypothetical protein
MGAHHYMRGTSLMFAALGGVISLSKVLREESADSKVRVNEVLIGTRIEKVPRPGVVPSIEFGRSAVAIATGTQKGAVIKYPQ